MLSHIVRHMATVHVVGFVLALVLPAVFAFLSLGVTISLYEGFTLLLALQYLKLIQKRQTSLDLACIW